MECSAVLDVLNLGILITLLIIAAIVGDALNYALGYRMGSRVYEKGNLWFIKHDHLMAAKAFYERHGGKAIILARFVPLVRTFTHIRGWCRTDDLSTVRLVQRHRRDRVGAFP